MLLLRVPVRVAVLVALAMLVALATGAGVSASRPGQGERERGPVVDFVAVQADGTPVATLQPSEVEIRINGRLRTLRSLRRVTAAPLPPSADSAPALPAPFGTNDDVAAGRRIAFVIDEESFVAGREHLLRRAVDGLLSGFAPGDRAAVIVLPYGGMKVPFTSDIVRIRRAMDGVSSQGARTETGSDLACRTRRFLEALDSVLLTQAGRASPLTVVVFTAGLAAPRRDAPMVAGPGMCELLIDHFDHIAAAAGEARANVFLALPDDVGLGGERWRENIGGSNFLGSDNPLAGVEHLAGSTGGVRVALDATGTRALERVARESAAYYEAELIPERREIFGESLPLDVRVLRRGVTVRARPRMTLTRPAAEAAAPRLSLADVLFSRGSFTDVPLRTAGFTVRQADGQLRLGVVVETADIGASLASLGAALVGADDRVVARWFASETAGRPILGAMIAPPGAYRLRVAGIDSAGRFGAAEDAVRVGLTAAGPLSLGSLVLGVRRADAIVPRLQFGTEPTAIASFDIYGGAGGMQISTALELARTADGPPLASLPLTLRRATETRVVATGALPVGALPPGDYAVRGVVRLEDGTSARVTRTLRKAAQ